MASPRHLLRPGRLLFAFNPRAATTTPSLACRRITASLSSHITTSSLLRPCLQQRSYSTPTRAEEELKRLAKEAAWSRKDDKRPVNILIYHAGTARTTFLALVKVTSLLAGAFFLLLVCPAYIAKGYPPVDTAQMLCLGLTPAVFVALTTAPFVTHVHIRAPPSVVSHRAALERWVAGKGGKEGVLAGQSTVTLTTMSLIAKPRTSAMPLSELVARKRRFGLVNYVREQPADAAAKDAAARKWYHWRPVTNFYVQEGRPGQPRKVRYQAPKADRVEWWIWEAVQQRLAKSN